MQLANCSYREVAMCLCFKSNVVSLILLWNSSSLLAYKLLFNINSFMQVAHSTSTSIAVVIVFSVVAIISPFAGLLTDTKCSRHRVVICSSYSMIVMLVLIPLEVLVLAAIVIQKLGLQNFRITSPILLIVVITAIVFCVIVVLFIINGFQYGMDQLHDSSTEDFIAYIHWYVWTSYACSLITEVTWNLLFYDAIYVHYIDTIRMVGLCFLALTLTSTLLLLVVSLCIAQCRKIWFLREPPGRTNAYKLVYKVIRFACRHKVPLRRSAFTYCEDEKPSRIDLGKIKYGGPFTTKQVEDVKAFFGILKLLILICPAFLLQTVVQSILPAFATHGKLYILQMSQDNQTSKHQVYLEGPIRHMIISNGLLSPLLVTICIPLYLWVIRPRVLYHVPGILKRIGMGMGLIVLSLLSTLIMDLVVHIENSHAECMFQGYTDLSEVNRITVNATEIESIALSPLPSYKNIYFLVFQYILSSLINMLMDVGVLELICSQSPYSMKGLVFGLLFSLRSLFHCLGIVAIVPFTVSWDSHLLSCGSTFYLVCTVAGILTFALFSCVARKYKYRIVNEASKEYQYAEEYYSNIQ